MKAENNETKNVQGCYSCGVVKMERVVYEAKSDAKLGKGHKQPLYRKGERFTIAIPGGYVTLTRVGPHPRSQITIYGSWFGADFQEVGIEKTGGGV